MTTYCNTRGVKQVNQLINQTEACREATLAWFFFFCFSNWRILHYLLTCLASLAVTAEGVGFQGNIWVRNRVFKARNLNNKPVESLINKPYQIQYSYMAHKTFCFMGPFQCQLIHLSLYSCHCGKVKDTALTIWAEKTALHAAASLFFPLFCEPKGNLPDMNLFF